MTFQLKPASLITALISASTLISMGAQAFDTSANPEAASGMAQGKTAVAAKKFMAATANPLATDAAYQILAKGGSAVDAAIAAQAVLGLTEPQSSGLAGGCGWLLASSTAARCLGSWSSNSTLWAGPSRSSYWPLSTAQKKM